VGTIRKGPHGWHGDTTDKEVSRCREPNAVVDANTRAATINTVFLLRIFLPPFGIANKEAGRDQQLTTKVWARE
jgi:hypothetical protein